VYYGDLVGPVARAAGVWDALQEDEFFEIDPVASEAYYPLVRDGQGVAIMGEAFLTGMGFPPLSDGGLVDVPLEHLHPIALRGSLERLPDGVDGDALVAAGLCAGTAAGWVLTGEGVARHARLLEAERRTLDLDALGPVYERFLAANGPFKAFSSRWPGLDEDARWAAAAEACDHDHVVSPRHDSIHAVWMEVHEDDLLTLGRSREEEGSY